MSETVTIHIPPMTGAAVELRAGQTLRVVDPEGQSTGDLFAFNLHDITEWLSNGRSFDYNGTIYLSAGHPLYSNRSNPMLHIVADTVGRHDFLYSPCSQEMYRIQHGAAAGHPNCLDNLTSALAKYGVAKHAIMTPFNLFMNVDVLADGALAIRPPRSRAGDSILLRAEMDLAVAVTACPSSVCNNGPAKPLRLEVSRQAATGPQP